MGREKSLLTQINISLYENRWEPGGNQTHCVKQSASWGRGPNNADKGASSHRGQTASLLVSGRRLHCVGSHLVLFMGCHSGFSIIFPSSLILPKHKYTDLNAASNLQTCREYHKENSENVSRTFSRNRTTLQDCTYTGGTPQITSVCSFHSYSYPC